MSLSRVFQQLTFAAVGLAGLAFAAPSQAANVVRPQPSVVQSDPSVTLAHWEYRHHRRYWVEDRRHYRRYDRRN